MLKKLCNKQKIIIIIKSILTIFESGYTIILKIAQAIAN